MGREMGCREEREVGGDGWVNGRIRGIARQAFSTRFLPYTAPTRCPSRMHTCEHVHAHTLTLACVHVLAMCDWKKIQKICPISQISPSLWTLALIHRTISSLRT